MPTWLAILVGSPPAMAMAAWVVRTLVWDRLNSLEASVQRLGTRIGELESRCAVLDARIQDFRDYSGVVKG